MIRKIIRSGIAVMVAFSILLIPNTALNGHAAAASIYDDAAKQAQAMADALVSAYGETSVQYALIDDGDIVISGQSGVYSKSSTTQLTGEHMYGIGSVSKMFTTAAVMQLVEQGKVKLDTPVVKYIPQFKMADKRYKDITVRMLLNHSSGLMGSTLSNAMLFDDNDTVSMDTLLKELSTQRLKAAPGAFSVYCNDGFSLAQLLVEKVSGVGFQEYVKKYISDPLALGNTQTPLDDFNRDQLVKTYLAGSGAALPVENVNAIGAGGIYSTAEDLCRFAEMFLYETEDKVLSDASSEAMAKSEYLSGMWGPDEDSSLSYGLGWDSVNTYPFNQYGIKALVKLGDSTMYHAALIALPEENMAMAVLSSGGASTYNQVLAQEVLLKALHAKGSVTELIPDKTFTAPVPAVMPASEKENAGYYAFMGGLFSIQIGDDGILTWLNGAQPQKFVYTGDGKFYYGDGSTYVSFQKESNGNTYLYLQGYSTLPYLGQAASASYQGQKIQENPLSDKIKAAWEERNGKLYFLLNEKYSSAAYPLSIPFTMSLFTEGIEGYIQNSKITGANTAQMQLEIPGMLGRDLSDVEFYTKGKAEYLKASAALYIREDAVTELPADTVNHVEIGKDGYAVWYKIGSEAVNKTIKVTLPKNASFSIYTTNGICTYSSVTAHITVADLPANGVIVFAGDAGANFTVRYVQ